MSATRKINGCISSWCLQGWVTGTGAHAYARRFRQLYTRFVLMISIKKSGLGDFPLKGEALS